MSPDTKSDMSRRDAINWVLNSRPLKAAGLGGQNIVYEPRGRDTSDNFTVLFEYPGKIQVNLPMIKYAAWAMCGAQAPHPKRRRAAALHKVR